ncbi:hypothetical protein L207DRAFT_552817 [Hyaloscypha variabilis F]|uniref:NACHT domain-containing protein n=1 Tax=Hyaloscypha variabilis (strain UAMH 11265 / GT02V1 / F) TaxID=1149755 RepID=A0A2J6S1V7_HYAVF|nr:hypothetical protein L207DRAFT_552817 [Hyaloscypha variabilis F]
MANPYDPVQFAFEKSIRDFKANLKDDRLYSEILQTTTIDQVYNFTEKLQADQNKDGHMRHLAKIGPFLENLRGYAGVIEVFIQVKPEILALIWGPIKLLLQWTSVLKQSFDGLIKTIADIGNLLPEFKEVVRLFGHNKQINDVLALFFQDILDIYAIALKFFSASRWRIIFEAMWPKQQDKIRVVMSHIERHTLLMRNEVRLEHIREEYDARLRALEHFEKTERSHLRQEYNTIKEAISPRTYEDELYRIRGRICEGTGKWLLRDATFAEWIDGSEKPTKPIWLQGIPGAGKTYLSSTVIDHALSKGRTLFAFLSYKFSSSISALSIIHSLIFQLTSDDDDLQAILCQYASKELRRELKRAVELLTILLTTTGPVFIVIDGIDEIDEIERRRLLQHLLELSNDCDNVKVLVCSRIEDDIDAILRGKAVKIRIDDRNAGSIQAFVSRQVQEWFLSRDFLSEARTEIQGLLAPLSSKANGMFLYAKVVLTSIEHLDNMIAIRNELQVLPENLDDAYARILERINNLNPLALRDKARKLLGWVGSSPTPLSIYEIEQALNIKMDDIKGNVRVIARLNPVRVCGPILEVVDDYVEFVHFTAKEYIFSPHIPNCINISDATLSLATCCIQYLCQEHHDTDLSDDELRENLLAGAYRLHEYSATIWPELVERYIRFAKSASPPSDLIKLIQLLIEKRSSDEFSNDGSTLLELSAKQSFKWDYPEIHEILRKAVCFRIYLTSKGNSWINLDPLTITRTSIRLYKEFDQLLCGSGDYHMTDCHCVTIQRHSGQRPFKCSFLGCYFSRHGFPIKSARNSHQSHHERPWKCSKSDCLYFQGFFSRKSWLQQKPDKDEIQPLLFDLIRADKVELVKNLIPQLVKFPIEVKNSLFSLAARSGSTAMVNLFEPGTGNIVNPGDERPYGEFIAAYGRDVRERSKGRHDFMNVWTGLHAAIRGTNIETFRHLLLISRKNHLDIYALLLPEILKCKSEEFRLDWELNVEAEYEACVKNPLSNDELLKFGSRYTTSPLLKTATGNSENATFILLLWEKIDLAKILNPAHLGSTLGYVAGTCRSIKLAKYLIDAGVPVDSRRRIINQTPLHHALRVNTPEAAELAKFLLGLGADPSAFAETGRGSIRTIKRIRDEIGAKGISKWLGISWDDLVERIRAERMDASEHKS